MVDSCQMDKPLIHKLIALLTFFLTDPLASKTPKLSCKNARNNKLREKFCFAVLGINSTEFILNNILNTLNDKNLNKALKQFLNASKNKK